MNFCRYVQKRADISNANISQTQQLTPKQSRWMNSTTGAVRGKEGMFIMEGTVPDWCHFMSIACGSRRKQLSEVKKNTYNNAALLLLKLYRADLVLGGSYTLKQFVSPFRVRVASLFSFTYLKNALTSGTPSTHHNGLQYQTPLKSRHKSKPRYIF